MSPRLFRALPLLLILALALGCKGKPTQQAQVEGAPNTLSSASSVPAPTGTQHYPARSRAELPPVPQPAMPATIPGYTELDPETGLHMTGGPTLIQLASWRLKVGGKVRFPLELDYDSLRMLPGIRTRATIICRGYFEDTAVWAGASLASILEAASPLSSAKGLSLIGADGYSASVTMEQAKTGDNFIAYELAGRPVTVLQGFPARAAFPSLLGNKWTKWLLEIRVE
ncbi:MAG TPA: molybdopterin-dependent oxidoreductase [Rectinemataceae bacterium]|nr:molybdopterin-dependent oxidoreductase [Rectinemataceae bacterium]